MSAERTDRRDAWTRELALWWRHYDREYANASLREPRFALVEGLGSLGRWDRHAREIALRLEHVARDPWQEAMATLRHEMAHQYAEEVLLAVDEPPHGPAFRRACELLRVEARASASERDGVAAAADDDAARLTRRISKLLALGASPNEHEATAAVALARSLMLEHNLDVIERDEARGFAQRTLGAVRRRHAAWESALASVLSEFFFVEVLWAKDYDPVADVDGTVLFAYGTPANLDMAAYVHAFLSELLPRLWTEHRRAHAIAGDRDRGTYYAGVLDGFLGSLRDADRARRSGSRALVWRGDPKLAAYYRWHHPRIRTTRVGARLGDAYAAGEEAGRRGRRQRPIETRGRGIAGHLSAPRD